jgi:hypothetical protein
VTSELECLNFIRESVGIVLIFDVNDRDASTAQIFKDLFVEFAQYDGGGFTLMNLDDLETSLAAARRSG